MVLTNSPFMKSNLIKEKSFAFSLHSIELYKLLKEAYEFTLANQFFKSATSIGANVNEATAGISYRDFTAKMSIASKEARETIYWLDLIEAGKFIDYDFGFLKNECLKIANILSSIVKSCQKNINS